MVRITAFLIFSLFFSFAYGQTEPPKFGKVTKAELLMDSCSFYPEANSMILSSAGHLRFAYLDKGWQFLLDVTVRKKIFELTDKDQGSIKIRTYEPVNTGSDREEINQLKAVTYNLENGKIVKAKLANSEKFKTRLSDYRVEYSFAMPEVREGSVIEYKYTLRSDYYVNLKTWNFQNEIPTAISRFDYRIPEYFYYQPSQVGTPVNPIVENKNVLEQFTYSWTELPQSGGAQEKRTATLNSNSNRTIITAYNIPPVEDEPYQNNRTDLISRLEFQLQSIQYPNQLPENIASDYENFNKRILEWSSFGGVLDKGGFAKDLIATLSDKDELSKAKDIYSWVSKNTIWDDVYGYTGGDAGRKTMTDGSGSVGDINLTLVAALRKAGLQADPVILSTRGNGTVHPVYPSMEEFNFVIVSLNTEEGTYLLDAASDLPFGMLPTRCYNGNGWKASESGGSWVDLKIGEASKRTICEIAIDDEKITRKYTVKEGGHYALNTANKVNKDGKEDFAAKLGEGFDEGEVTNFNYPEENKVNELNYSFDCSIDFDQEDVVYLSMLDVGAVKENPFKRETRLSPVDYRYKESLTNMVKIKIPEGYKAQVPESKSISLPNKGGAFIFSCTQMGNEITIVSRFSRSKTLFSPNEYPVLKEFYQIVADKHSEVITLTKL